MRVLFITQHYAPEVTAAVARVGAFAEGLAERGHEVEVITALPNHPEGVIAEPYRGRRRVREQLNGVDVNRVWIRVRPEKSTVNRLAAYASFAASAVAAGSTASRPDIVLTSSPPLPVAAAAATVARRHRAPWVMDVRDIWPEAAVVFGELRGAQAIAAAERLERRLYRSATRIVAATEPFRATIAGRCEDAEKVSVIMNGTTGLWMDAGEREPDRAAAGFDQDEFVLGYGGNVGLGQGIEAAVDAAGELGRGFRLLILGAGPRLDTVRDQASLLAEAKVDFRPLLPPAEAAQLLRACDALLVPLAASPELEKYVPSKLFDYSALGLPVVVSAAGESQRLVTEAGAGVAVPPEDAGALAEAVRKLRNDPAERERLGPAARAFAGQHLREQGVDSLERVLADAAGQRPGA